MLYVTVADCLQKPSVRIKSEKTFEKFAISLERFL